MKLIDIIRWTSIRFTLRGEYLVSLMSWSKVR